MLSGQQLTNSSSTNSRRAGDYYSTPEEATVALLRVVNIHKSKVIWEPASGSGAITNILIREGFGTVASDIAPQMIAIERDFLTFLAPQGHWIITNPPFSLAGDFISHAFSLFDYGLEGFAMLLKSQFWHASKRLALFRTTKPAMILPLTWRPDFLAGERGGSPVMEVAWTVWLRGHYGETRYIPVPRPGVRG